MEVKAQLKDDELLKRFKEVELLSDKDKSCIRTLIEALLMRKQLQ